MPVYNSEIVEVDDYDSGRGSHMIAAHMQVQGSRQQWWGRHLALRLCKATAEVKELILTKRQILGVHEN